MRTFFDDIDTLHRFTLELDHHRASLACPHCSKCGQFVAHGFVHKKHSQGLKRTVGKRILCSNRYGKSGCGRTQRLYLTSEVPMLQYTAQHLFTFLSALLTGLSVHGAYAQATGCSEPRNAFRWLNKLQRKLSDYRSVLVTRPRAAFSPPNCRTRRLQLLLTTLQQLFALPGLSNCRHYQQRFQQTFV